MELSIGLMRIITRIFYLFPIKKEKVILTAYNGRQYSCSPKYLTEALLKNGKYQVYYAVSNTVKHVVPQGAKIVKYRSFSHFYHLMTAGYIVVNSSGLTNLMPYRKKQVLINTWHGGGYFKIMGDDFFTSKSSMKKRKISGDNTNYFLASCEAFAAQLPHSMKIDENKIARVGLPRNDIFFTDTTEIKERIFNKYSINKEDGIVIYAPTYRDGMKTSIKGTGIVPIDVEGVVATLEKRFNRRFIFMYRAHHDMIPDDLSPNCINASDHDDMQELLAAADVFISDYSSCMWDFSLQKKPGFLYAPDLEKYEAEHPFGTKTEDWPYSLYLSNESMLEAILSFDEEKNIDKIDNFLRIAGSYECGRAAEIIINKLMKND